MITAPADRSGGVPWAIDERALRHPLIAPFRQWQLANVDFVRNPRRAWKYWAAEAPPEHVVVSYEDDPDPTKRKLAEPETPVEETAPALTEG